ncbi:hypothetical protein SprV_0401607400 [Sparganum proliferum]
MSEFGKPAVDKWPGFARRQSPAHCLALVLPLASDASSSVSVIRPESGHPQDWEHNGCDNYPSHFANTFHYLLSRMTTIEPPAFFTEFGKRKCSLIFIEEGHTLACRPCLSSSPNRYKVLCNATFPKIQLSCSNPIQMGDWHSLEARRDMNSSPLGFTYDDVFGYARFELINEDQVNSTDILRVTQVFPRSLQETQSMVV